jgi:phospholipase A1
MAAHLPRSTRLPKAARTAGAFGALALILGLLLASEAPAATPDMVLVPPVQGVTAGQEAVFGLLITNAEQEPAMVILPDPLRGRLLVGETCYLTTPRLVEGPAEAPLTVPPGGFRRLNLAVVVPPEAGGHVTLKLEALDVAPVIFAMGMPSPSLAARVTAGETVCEEETQRIEGIVHSRMQPYAANLSFYQPMYFLVGASPDESKFQLSFKYQLLSSEGSLARAWPWVTGFHFGYTQTSYWDLESDSEPFDDTSYKPELFFTSPNLDTGLPWMSVLKIQTGLQHESNGLGGEDSRSTNYLYLKPIFIVGSGQPYALTVAPRFWAYVGNDDDTNRDLDDYRGYFDLELRLGRAEGFMVSSLLRWADEGPSVQADVTYPIGKLFSDNLDLYLQAQYFRGYAESLLRYEEETEAFRLGVAIVR